MANTEDMRGRIEEFWGAKQADRFAIMPPATDDAVRSAIQLLSDGKIRVADPPTEPGTDWTVNSWVQKAINLYFPLATMRDGQYSHDKIPPKPGHVLMRQQIRVVEGGVVRHGSFCEPGVVVMPGFVNIGAYVAKGTMVDTWATVGSGAQIGENVHLAGGVGIGGILEPPGAVPVIVGNNAFLGSRAIVVEGTQIGDWVVLGANVCITASSPVFDATGNELRRLENNRIPDGAVVLPGVRKKMMPGGFEIELNCAYIVKWREPGEPVGNLGLNDMLR